MKEFDYPLEGIFKGITPKEDKNKTTVELLDCHNIEPLGEDVGLHEFVIDFDADDYAWGNP